MCNPIRDDEPTSDLTVCGFAGDPERAGPITWQPTGCEARSEALAQIYALAYAEEQDTGAGGASERTNRTAESSCGFAAISALLSPRTMSRSAVRLVNVTGRPHVGRVMSAAQVPRRHRVLGARRLT